MLNKDFFERSLKAHVTEKAKHAAGGSATVKLHLANGWILTLWHVEEVADAFVVVAFYPLGGKPRKTPKEERDLGAPQFDFDRLAIPYHTITLVEITTTPPKDNTAGYQP